MFPPIGNVAITETLIENGASINAKTKVALIVPVHIAAQKGNVNVTELLCQKSSTQVLARSKNRYTPLHYAAENGSLIAWSLLNEASEIQFKCKKNHTFWFLNFRRCEYCQNTYPIWSGY